MIKQVCLILPQPQVEVLSEEEGEEEDEEEDILSLAEEKYRPAALEKMIALIALLVEQSRSERWDSEIRGVLGRGAILVIRSPAVSLCVPDI